MSCVFLFHGHYLSDPNSLVGVLVVGVNTDPPWSKVEKINAGEIEWTYASIVKPISGDRRGVVLSEAEMARRAAIISLKQARRERVRQQVRPQRRR